MFSKPRKDFTDGPIFFRITLFALPVMLTGLLQILYGMADNIVVGRFSGDIYALGAVGSTTSLTNLTLHLLLGLSVGSSVVAAQAFGAKREREVSRTAHTAMTAAVFGGILFCIIGLLISRPALTLMGTKPELIESAVLYFRIICLGIPASAIYNFGAALLRAVGDSKTPLIILSTSGLLNVFANLFFVLACGMSVEGVAIATILSQYVSATAVTLVLFHRGKKGECYGLALKKYCFDTSLFKKILRFGVPAGIQSSMFGISNVLLTSGINTFTPAVVKAYTISANIDALTYTVCSAFATATMTFVAQNYGAQKLSRIKRTLIFAIIQTTVAGLLVGLIEYIFVDQISLLYLDVTDPAREEILYHVKEITSLLLFTYFLCGIMEVISATVRALGYAFSAMLISIGGICVLRTVWVFFVFPLEAFNTPGGLLTSYPVTWSTTALCHFILFLYAWHKVKKRLATKKDGELKLEAIK